MIVHQPIACRRNVETMDFVIRVRVASFPPENNLPREYRRGHVIREQDLNVGHVVFANRRNEPVHPVFVASPWFIEA